MINCNLPTKFTPESYSVQKYVLRLIVTLKNRQYTSEEIYILILGYDSFEFADDLIRCGLQLNLLMKNQKF